MTEPSKLEEELRKLGVKGKKQFKGVKALIKHAEEQAELRGRVDELLSADDEIRLHNKVGRSYQNWFEERLAALEGEDNATKD